MSLFGEEDVFKKKQEPKKKVDSNRVIPINNTGGVDFTKIDLGSQEQSKEEKGKIAPEIDYVGEQETNS